MDTFDNVRPIYFLCEAAREANQEQKASPLLLRLNSVQELGIKKIHAIFFSAFRNPKHGQSGAERVGQLDQLC